jgi:hypothetical protein
MAQQIKKKFLSPELIGQVDTLEQSVTALGQSKADKSYVDQKDGELASSVTALQGVVQGNFDLQQTDIELIRSDATANSNAISSEQAAREAADANLQSQIDNVLSNVNPEALDSLSEIVSAFQAADNNLNGAITQLATELGADIAAEETARIAADAVLQGKIDEEQSLRNTGDVQTLDAAKAYTDTQIAAIPAVDLSGYYTKAEVDTKEDALEASISDLDVYAQEIRGDHDNLEVYAQDIRSDVDGHESRIAVLEAQTDGPSFADEHKLMSEQPSLSYLDLGRKIKKVMSCSVGRASIHESIDFTVSNVTVGGAEKTRLTFIGSLVNPTGEEAIESTDMVHVVYAY